MKIANKRFLLPSYQYRTTIHLQTMKRKAWGKKYLHIFD